MTKPLLCLVAVVVVLAAISSAGPTLVALAHAAVPLVVALGLVIAVVRLVFHFTNRY